MFTVEVSCLVDRPREAVFAYVADFRNAVRWQPQLRDIVLEGGPFPDGTVVVEVHTFLGVRVEARGDLVRWDAPHGFTVRGRSGVLNVQSDYGFTTEPGGTRVRLVLTLHSRGPARLGEPILRRQITKDLTRAFIRLGVTLQKEVPADPAGGTTAPRRTTPAPGP